MHLFHRVLIIKGKLFQDQLVFLVKEGEKVTRGLLERLCLGQKDEMDLQDLVVHPGLQASLVEQASHYYL